MSFPFNRRDRSKPSRRRRIPLQLDGLVAYAIGDVHGCYRELISLEQRIVADAEAFEGDKLLILLGDFVDRGPDSARVISHLLKPPPPRFQRICLVGNHEICMLRYLDGEIELDDWLAMGGLETLYSYGLDPAHLARLYNGKAEMDAYIRDSIPAEHVAFMRDLPIMAYTPKMVFVHAGIRPGVPLEEQDDNDLTTIRREFLDNSRMLDRIVIHGHTPVKFPKPNGREVSIDTGAFETGRLTGLRIIGQRGRLIFS